MSQRWFSEELYPDFKQQIAVESVLFEGRSQFQNIMLFNSSRFGRVLALDGVIQTTEADEFCYHEMIVHVPLFAHGMPKRVLIIGGGDGGTLEEVLKHPVEEAVMVEIDGMVVDLCRKFIPSIPGNAFDDPRTDLVIGDGVKFVADDRSHFDVIIIDSTDPMGPAVPLFGAEFYANCKARLAPGGILVSQSGVSFMQDDEARATHARIASLFDDVAFYLTQVPSYGAGFMTLGWGATDPASRQTQPSELDARFTAAAIETRYYTPAIHQAAFALPRYIGALAAAPTGESGGKG